MLRDFWKQIVLLNVEFIAVCVSVVAIKASGWCWAQIRKASEAKKRQRLAGALLLQRSISCYREIQSD